MVTSILVASISSALIALILAVLLIFSSKIFRVEVDERVTEVTEMLPGANCGGCGYPGCAQFAKALVADEAPVDGCSVGGVATAEAVAKYLGKVTPPQKDRTRAYIFCHGHKDIAKSSQVYNGAQTCVSAVMAGGNKDCSYGCVGFYDCMKACDFGAIIKDEKTGMPVIVEDKCVSCNACVKSCPQKLIEIHPVSQKFHVYCKSKDKGPIAKKACDRACIGCSICVKNTKEGGMRMDNNLAIVNYEDYAITEESIAKCPTKAITDERVNSVANL